MESDKSVEFKIIGTIHTPHRTIENIPIQPVAGEKYNGVIEILPELTDALQDLEGFSHIMILISIAWDLTITCCPLISRKRPA